MVALLLEEGADVLMVNSRQARPAPRTPPGDWPGPSERAPSTGAGSEWALLQGAGR